MMLFCASLSLLKFSFLSYVQVFSCEFFQFVAWNIRTIVFFPFLFPSYYCSVDLYIFSAPTGRYNKSSFALFNVVFESLRWCIRAIFNAGESTSAFFSCHIKSIISLFKGFVHRDYLSYPQVHLLKFFLRLFQEWSRVFYKETAQVFIPLIRFILHNLVSRSFLVRLRYSSYFFFHLHLFDDVHFQYSQVLVGFHFS